MSPDQNTVTALIDSMRRDAEGSVHSLGTTISTSSGAKAVAAVVAGFYNFLGSLGSEIIRMQTALAIAQGRDPQNVKIAAQLGKATQLLTYWTALAQGFATYVRPATDAERATGPANNVGNPIAVAVVVVAVAGAVAVIAVSLTGAAWAVVHYEQAQNLAAEVELLKADPTTAAALAKINEGGGAGPGAGPSAGMIAAGVVTLGAIGAGILYVVKSKG